MSENLALGHGEGPGPLGDEPEQQPVEEGGLRRASEAVALVSASALLGGGIGMLGGVALGAINPFALGIIGVAVGTGVLVLFALDARQAVRGPWWLRWFGG
jgi:hypothetical protein